MEIKEAWKEPLKIELTIEDSEEFEGLHLVTARNKSSWSEIYHWEGRDLEDGLAAMGKSITQMKQSWEMRRQRIISDEREQALPALVEAPHVREAPPAVDLGEHTDKLEVVIE